MAQKHTLPKQVISIDTYRRSRAEGSATLLSHVRHGRLPDPFFKDWSILLERLKCELSEIDGAILALMKLAAEENDSCAAPANASQRKLGRS